MKPIDRTPRQAEPHTRVQLTRLGKAAQIVPNDRPHQSHGLQVGRNQKGHVIVIPDGLETAKEYHPKFWEPEDPDFKREVPPLRLLCEDLRAQYNAMPPGTVVQMAQSGNPPLRGTLIAWSWQRGQHGRPYDTLKIVLDSKTRPTHYDPENWKVGTINPEELHAAFVSAANRHDSLKQRGTGKP